MCESALITGNGQLLPAAVDVLSSVEVMVLRRSGGGDGSGAAHEAAGQGTGVLAVGVGLGAGDERVQVAVGALQEPLAPGGQVVAEHRRVQGQALEVDDVDVGAPA